MFESGEAGRHEISWANERARPLTMFEKLEGPAARSWPGLGVIAGCCERDEPRGDRRVEMHQKSVHYCVPLFQRFAAQWPQA